MSLAAALPPMIWGSTYLVTTRFLPPGKPLTAAVLRILPVGLAMVLATRYWPQRAHWRRLVLISLFCMSLMHWPLFVAAYRLPGGMAALLVCTQPLLVSVLGWLWFDQRTSAGMLACVAVGFLGVLLVLLSPGRMVWDGIGVAAASVAAVSMAIGTLLVKRWRLPIPLVTFVGWQLLIGGALLLPAMLLTEGLPAAIGAASWGGYLYLALVGTGLTYLLWFHALRALDPVRISVFLLLSPVSAMFLGYVVLGQALTPLQLAGAALVFGGVFISLTSCGSALRGESTRTNSHE